MLAGDPTRRAFDESDPAQDAIRYLCLGTNLAESHGKLLPSSHVGLLDLPFRVSRGPVSRRHACANLLSPLLVRLSSISITETNLTGTESTTGSRDRSTSRMGRVVLMEAGNARLPILRE
jgi:hypothetical protein